MTDARTRATFAGMCLLAVAAVGLAYSNSFHNAFHFDDSHVIVENLAIRSLHDVPSFFRDVGTFTSRPENAVYRPLLTLSFALDYRIADGLDPLPFHRTQFALLLFLGALLVFVFQRLADLAEPGQDHRTAALLAATLFSIHTANTETVNYLSSRSDLLSTLGIVGSFALYVGWPRGRRTLLYLLPMLVGGLAKPLTVMLGPLLVVYLLFFEEDASLPALLRPAAWRILASVVWRALPALLAGSVLFLFLRHMEGEALVYAQVRRTRYLISQPFVWLHYLRLFFLPYGLTADTDWEFLDSWHDPRFLAGVAGLLLLAGAIVWLSVHRSLRPSAFGLAWFAIALLPTSSFFPLSEVYNEHRVFFPYVGLTFAAVHALAVGTRRLASHWPRAAPRIRRLAAAIAVLWIAAHGIGTHARNRVWKDDLTLWKDVSEKSPRNGRGLMNYGLALMSRGRLEEALDLFERAQAHVPNYEILEINLGIVKSALQRDGEAERHFERALRLAPNFSGAHSYYARWLVEHGRGPEAVAHLSRALELSPGVVDPRYLLMDIHAATGNVSDLADQVRQTLAIDPGDPRARAYAAGQAPGFRDGTSARNEALARSHLERGNWVDAAIAFRRATDLDPAATTAWTGLAQALTRMGFPKEAALSPERAR